MALRSAFLLQALLGLGLTRLLMGQAPSELERNLHLVLGLAAAALAVLVLRPSGGDGLVATGRFFPLLPLLVGLLFRIGAIGGLWVVYLHIALGFAAVGLIEAALARRRRGAREAA